MTRSKPTPSQPMAQFEVLQGFLSSTAPFIYHVADDGRVTMCKKLCDDGPVTSRNPVPGYYWMRYSSKGAWEVVEVAERTSKGVPVYDTRSVDQLNPTMLHDLDDGYELRGPLIPPNLR